MISTTIAVASDLHYISPRLTDYGTYFQKVIESADGKAMMYSEELVNAFVRQIIAESPSMLIIPGDLSFNGARISLEDLAGKLEQIEDAGIPVYVIPGNHDIDSIMSASFEGESFTRVENTSAEQFIQIYQQFAYSEAIASDTGSCSYVAQPDEDLRLLMVDVNGNETPGILTDATLAWVEEQLRDASEADCKVIAVSHQNVLAHNSLFQDGFVMANHEKLQKLYEQYHVICNLSGHMHIQDVKTSEGDLTEILTSCLTLYPNQYGLLVIDDTEASYETKPVSVTEVEDFETYAHDFFWNSTRRQALSQLADYENAESLASYMADTNVAYFSGRPDTIVWDDGSFDEWRKANAFWGAYLLSIQKSGTEDVTNCRFSIAGE